MDGQSLPMVNIIHLSMDKRIIAQKIIKKMDLRNRYILCAWNCISQLISIPKNFHKFWSDENF